MLWMIDHAFLSRIWQTIPYKYPSSKRGTCTERENQYSVAEHGGNHLEIREGEWATAIRYVFKDKTAPYKELLQRIGTGSTLESHRIQDMLITINCCLQERDCLSIMNLK